MEEPKEHSPDRRPAPRRARATLALACAGMYLAAVIACVAIAARVDAPAGLLGLVVVVCTAPLCAAALSRGGRRDSRTDEIVERLGAIESRLAESPEVRRIKDRGAERAALRGAIEEEIGAGRYDAAMVMLKELAERHGLRQQAEGFRARIEEARTGTQGAEVDEALAGLDALIGERRWDLALADAARITRLYPDSPRAERLRDRVEQARGAHKDDLERRFLLATREDRVGEAMALLRELDQFLTEVEAEPYRELARGIIGKARDNLGAQFKLAVGDRRWAEAAGLGARIIEEFPNSRMAAEVRGIIDGVRERAAKLDRV